MADGTGYARKLRVAILSTCSIATPPEGYGGTELVVAELARELKALGHEPTVFATGDSTCVGARSCGFDKPVWPPDPYSEMRHASAAWEAILREGDFDIVHANTPEALAFARFADVPTVATIHHERMEPLALHYASLPDVHFVAISRSQAELTPEVRFSAVVHHGLDIERYPEGEGGDACAFLGRFAPEKGTHLALDAARAAGVPLAVGGDAHPHERAYFEREVKPRLAAPGVSWLGEIGHERKLELLRRAKGMLFPIEWEEPFGLVMIEAMLVGTPVISFPRGAAKEIIEEGVTGFLVNDADEMAARIRELDRIDRRACRESARGRWSSMRMGAEYARLYLELARPRPSVVPLRTSLDSGEHDVRELAAVG